MPSYLFLPKDTYKLLEVGKKEGNNMICLGEEPNTYMSDPRESFEELSYVYILKINWKTQVSELIDVRGIWIHVVPLFNYPR